MKYDIIVSLFLCNIVKRTLHTSFELHLSNNCHGLWFSWVQFVIQYFIWHEIKRTDQICLLFLQQFSLLIIIHQQLSSVATFVTKITSSITWQSKLIVFNFRDSKFVTKYWNELPPSYSAHIVVFSIAYFYISSTELSKDI